MKVILSILGSMILIGSAAGCLLLPIPLSNRYAVAGTKLESTTISFIKPGTTTRAEVIQKLGEPSLDMPELDLIAYTWAQVDYHLVLILVGSTGVGGNDWYPSQPYVFFVAFDQKGRVLGCELEKKIGPIQVAAREWKAQEGLAVPTLPYGFIARDSSPAQALLYIYRPGGFRDLPAISELRVDGKLQADLMKGTYVAVPLSPGAHSVTVVIERGGDPPDSGESLSLNLTEGRKYFVSFRVNWASLPEPVITLQSEEEAMPELTKMKPAR